MAIYRHGVYVIRNAKCGGCGSRQLYKGHDTSQDGRQCAACTVRYGEPVAGSTVLLEKDGSLHQCEAPRIVQANQGITISRRLLESWAGGELPDDVVRDLEKLIPESGIPREIERLVTGTIGYKISA